MFSGCSVNGRRILWPSLQGTCAFSLSIMMMFLPSRRAFQPRRFDHRHQFFHGKPTFASVESTGATADVENPVPLYRCEGLFAVNKPLTWTSQDMVSYIRGMLERDARSRGAKPAKINSRRNKSRIIRVGHGGTLDPLATGVLVIGVGRGTKELQRYVYVMLADITYRWYGQLYTHVSFLESYLEGSKRYTAGVELGFETNTLDMDGNVTKTAPFDNVTLSAVDDVLPKFVGEIAQVPPVFSKFFALVPRTR